MKRCHSCKAIKMWAVTTTTQCLTVVEMKEEVPSLNAIVNKHFQIKSGQKNKHSQLKTGPNQIQTILVPNHDLAREQGQLINPCIHKTL